MQLAAGTNPKIVSEVLGHKDVAITLDRYSHALPTMQVEAMARLDAMLGRSLLDAPDDGEGEAPAPNLWLDDELGASPDAPRTRHKGSYKGSSTKIQGNKRKANLVPHTGFLVKCLMRLTRVHPVHPRDA